MMYDTSNQKAREIVNTTRDELSTYRIGTISFISPVDKEVYVNFIEGDLNIKSYKFLSSYTPKEGDNVLLLRTGRTYVILGKLEKYYDKT